MNELQNEINSAARRARSLAQAVEEGLMTEEEAAKAAGLVPTKAVEEKEEVVLELDFTAVEEEKVENEEKEEEVDTSEEEAIHEENENFKAELEDVEKEHIKIFGLKN